MLQRPLYVASYHQSRFGKLKTMQVPEIVSSAITVLRPAGALRAMNTAYEMAGVAATFNIGGPICASVCTVLKRAA